MSLDAGQTSAIRFCLEPSRIRQSAFRLCWAPHVHQFGDLIQVWMISQIGCGIKDLNLFICDRNNLGGSAVEA